VRRALGPGAGIDPPRSVRSGLLNAEETAEQVASILHERWRIQSSCHVEPGLVRLLIARRRGVSISSLYKALEEVEKVGGRRPSRVESFSPDFVRTIEARWTTPRTVA
jgi:DNA invertase Pin-like site-specific DNA recombinase